MKRVLLGITLSFLWGVSFAQNFPNKPVKFIVGFGVPWAKRPLEFGDDGRGPWFEGGGVTVSR